MEYLYSSDTSHPAHWDESSQDSRADKSLLLLLGFMKRGTARGSARLGKDTNVKFKLWVSLNVYHFHITVKLSEVEK